MSGIGIRCRHKRAKHNSGTHSKDQGFAHISLLLFPPSKLPSLVRKTRKRERLICCQSVSQHARQTRQAACLPCNTLDIRSDAAIGSRTTVLSLGLPSHANGIPTRSPPQNLGGLSPDSCRGRSMASTEATGQQPSFRPAILYGSEPIRKATPVVFHQLWTPRRAGRAPWRLGGERERPNPQG
jgi:hypothetical protein